MCYCGQYHAWELFLKRVDCNNSILFDCLHQHIKSVNGYQDSFINLDPQFFFTKFLYSLADPLDLRLGIIWWVISQGTRCSEIGALRSGMLREC